MLKTGKDYLLISDGIFLGVKNQIRQQISLNSDVLIDFIEML